MTKSFPCLLLGLVQKEIVSTPVAGLRVLAISKNGPHNFAAATDNQGRFRLELPYYNGWWLITISDPKAEFGKPQPIGQLYGFLQIEDGEEKNLGTLTIGPGHTNRVIPGAFDMSGVLRQLKRNRESDEERSCI